MIRTGKKFSKPEMSRVINGDKILSTSEEKSKRTRLDHVLVKLYPEYNRSTLQNFIKSGYVTVDGRVIKKPNTDIAYIENLKQTNEGDEETQETQKTQKTQKNTNPKIELKVPERQTPPDVKDLTLYEDDNILVLNKPAGMLSTKKGEFTPEVTLEDYGLLVHRLDRDTSGVVILAKNPATQSYLRKQFQDRKTHKTYYAIVEGAPKLDAAKIDLPIARNYKHPTTFLVNPNGKPSTTFYKVLKTEKKPSGKTYSLLELKPVTGRTHQLRVHLKYLGTPIVGDPIYGSETYRDKSRKPKNRLFLHAKSLEITIPGDKENADGAPEGKRATFDAPLPKSFEEFFA